MHVNTNYEIYSKSEMANRIRLFDWASTTLGAASKWSGSLRFHLNRILEAGFPTVIWWGNQYIQFCNDACFKLQQNNPIFHNIDTLGYSGKQTCPKLWSLIEKKIDEVVSNGKPLYIENELINDCNNTGHNFYWTCSFDPLRDEYGEIAGIATTFKEASVIYRQLERKEQEQSFLLDLTDQLRSWDKYGKKETLALNMLGKFLNADRVGFAEFCQDKGSLLIRQTFEKNGKNQLKGNYDLMNNRYDTVSAYQGSECIVNNDIFNDTSLTVDQCAAYQALNIGAMINIPLFKSGQLAAVLFAHYQDAHIWTDEELFVLKQSAERIWDALSISKAEEYLTKSEEQYRTLFQSLDEAFMVIDFKFDDEGKPLDYTFIQVNEAFEKQSGIKNVVGKTILQIMPDIEPTWINKYSSVAITRQPLRFEEYNVGTKRWYDVYAVAMEQSNSEVVVVFKDITERKFEDQRKDDFLSIASHELKTPLTSLNGYMFMLKNMMGKDADPKMIDVVERTSKQITKMTGLINSFLNISQLNTGKMVLQYENFNLAVLLQEIKDDISHRIHAYHVEFEAPKELFVYADQNKICQVIENLLTNAMKYSPSGSLIYLTCIPDQEEVIISVVDHGMGLYPDELDKVFQRFYRADTRNSETISGFGIGLYLCKEIIEQHGGRVGVESEPGKGSRFWVSLPLSSASTC